MKRNEDANLSQSNYGAVIVHSICRDNGSIIIYCPICDHFENVHE